MFSSIEIAIGVSLFEAKTLNATTHPNLKNKGKKSRKNVINIIADSSDILPKYHSNFLNFL